MRTGSRTVPRWGAWTARLALALGAAMGMAVSAGSAQAATPITHVVIIYQENHSFDNVLGYWCAVNKRCNGTRRGRLPNGSTVPLTQPPDIVPNVVHTNAAQRTAVDGGRMDGFARISGCAKATGYACYSEYRPGQIPNLIALAGRFAVSDRTFAMNPVPSFGAHVEPWPRRWTGSPATIPTSSPETRSGRAGAATASWTRPGAPRPRPGS